VPFEWSVVQHKAFNNSSSSDASRRLHPMMHAPAVGTSESIMCFGGVQLGVMQEVKVDNEVSWIKETMAGGLEPDYSKVYQVNHCTIWVPMPKHSHGLPSNVQACSLTGLTHVQPHHKVPQ
jgi:hypothetical protein